MGPAKTLVDMRFCEHCGWIIPRRRYEGPTGYLRKRYCSLKCAGAVIGKTKEKITDNYWTLHWRIRVARGPASGYDCEHCTAQAHDWAWLHDRDGQDVYDFISLCRKCHIAYDVTTPKAVETARRRGSYDTWNPERRKANGQRMKQWWESLSPEEKAEVTARRWETRRKNQEEKGQ